MVRGEHLQMPGVLNHVGERGSKQNIWFTIRKGGRRRDSTVMAFSYQTRILFLLLLSSERWQDNVSLWWNLQLSAV